LPILNSVLLKLAWVYVEDVVEKAGYGRPRIFRASVRAGTEWAVKDIQLDMEGEKVIFEIEPVVARGAWKDSDGKPATVHGYTLKTEKASLRGNILSR